MDDPISSGEQDASPQQDVKKKYEKPQIIYSAPLEAMAIDCSVSPGKGDIMCIALLS